MVVVAGRGRCPHREDAGRPTALIWLTARRGGTDPVCGMKVDRSRAVTKDLAGQTFYFCSEHCLGAFEADPDRYVDPARDRRGGGRTHRRDHLPAAADSTRSGFRVRHDHPAYHRRQH